jgi:dipeptidyl aminopeptidase/acylaminoacyl peptidase
VKFLRKNAAKYNVDVDRIAVIGGSAGGHLALMTAYTSDEAKYKSGLYDEYSDKVCAVIDLYGITNTLSWRYKAADGKLKTNGDIFLGAGVQENAQLWIDSSPALIVKDNAPPTLILHGTADAVVGIGQSIELEQILQQKNIRHKLITVEGAEHSFTFDSTTTNLWPQVLAFLEENLKNTDK